MKKIAVWGYGNYGSRMVRAVDRYWPEEYRITKIYDLRAETFRKTEPRIAVPSGIRKDFAEGLFDAVMIAVNLEQTYRQMNEDLDAWGIPVFQLGKPEDYVGAEAFEQDPSAELPQQQGYAFYAFRNLRGAVSYAPSNGIVYLFDKEGRALKEHWDAYWVKGNFTHQYDYPVRFDCPHQDIVFMPGDYCILAKLWSFNYSHFLFESMDCVQLLEESGFRGRYVINDRTCNRAVMNLYGIGDERILTTRDLTLGQVYSFERVFYPKLLNNDRKMSAKVLKRLSGHLCRGLQRNPGKYPPRLFVERTGTRKLLNCGELLERYGFVTIDPGRLSAEEQRNYFFNAELVVSPHGANSANSLYMRSGTVLIETFGKNWVKYSYINLMREKGVRYLPVVEGPIMPELPVMVTDPAVDYEVPEENLASAIDIAVELLSHKAAERTLSQDM